MQSKNIAKIWSELSDNDHDKNFKINRSPKYPLFKKIKGVLKCGQDLENDFLNTNLPNPPENQINTIINLLFTLLICIQLLYNVFIL